jgi:hypothetical protein
MIVTVKLAGGDVGKLLELQQARQRKKDPPKKDEKKD